jgi:glycosyltransferase involved in cell wall biosynthesis
MPEWARLWREADVFILPTRSEAFGIVLQEAAAAGLPAIATRLNAIPEIVADGETGILVPPGDPHALGLAIQQMAESRELRMRMGEKARERIERTASPEAYAAQLVKVLERIGVSVKR